MSATKPKGASPAAARPSCEIVLLEKSGARVLSHFDLAVEDAIEAIFENHLDGALTTSGEDRRSSLERLERVVKAPQKLLRREMTILEPSGELEPVFELSGDSLEELKQAHSIAIVYIERSSHTSLAQTALKILLEEYVLNLREHVFNSSETATSATPRFHLSCHARPGSVWLLAFDTLGAWSYESMSASFLEKRKAFERSGGFGLSVMAGQADTLIVCSEKNLGTIFAAEVPAGARARQADRAKSLLLWEAGGKG